MKFCLLVVLKGFISLRCFGLLSVIALSGFLFHESSFITELKVDFHALQNYSVREFAFRTTDMMSFEI